MFIRVISGSFLFGDGSPLQFCHLARNASRACKQNFVVHISGIGVWVGSGSSCPAFKPKPRLSLPKIQNIITRI